MSAAVVVPSFGRPELLAACLAALGAQSRPPDEVLVVGREDDEQTARAVAAASLPARFLTVATPGHLPPLRLGVRETDADVVCFVDDDAEPSRGWLEALLPHYDDSRVGGVGGLVFQPSDPERPGVRSVGRIGRTGRFQALHLERTPEPWGPRDVDVLRGTNMSFRRSLLLAYPWDARLNGGAATDYEVDLCAFVRRRGFRLVYDPDASVTHQLGPRPELGRAPSPDAIRTYSHNLVYVAGKALPPHKAVLTVLDAFLVGNRLSYGVVTAGIDTLLGRRPSLRGQVLPALAGKLAGLASLAAYARRGAEPLP